MHRRVTGSGEGARGAGGRRQWLPEASRCWSWELRSTAGPSCASDFKVTCGGETLARHSKAAACTLRGHIEHLALARASPARPEAAAPPTTPRPHVFSHISSPSPRPVCCQYPDPLRPCRAPSELRLLQQRQQHHPHHPHHGLVPEHAHQGM